MIKSDDRPITSINLFFVQSLYSSNLISLLFRAYAVVDMNQVLLYLPPEKQSVNVKRHLESEVSDILALGNIHTYDVRNKSNRKIGFVWSSISKWSILKVSKFLKQIFLFSFEPKNEQNYFLNYTLASKNGSNQKNKGTLLY